MPQDLIERIEEDLMPFDFEPDEDVRKLEARVEATVNLMERVFVEALHQAQECSAKLLE